jgi:hypothetical protein
MLLPLDLIKNTRDDVELIHTTIHTIISTEVNAERS